MDLLKNIFKGDKVIWIIFLCLCLISIIEVFSAASTLTYKSGDHWGPITQHSIILMVGAVVVVLMHNIPYKWFQVFPVFLYPVSVVLLAFVTLMGVITGDRVNGAARWMSFMGLQFQPSELAKMAVVIAVSFILSKKQDDEGANPKARAAFSQQLKNLQGYEITTVLAGEDGWNPVADGNKLITVKR